MGNLSIITIPNSFLLLFLILFSERPPHIKYGSYIYFILFNYIIRSNHLINKLHKFNIKNYKI